MRKRGDRAALARELHDGLAQELAYIASCADRLDAAPGAAPLAGRIQAAALHALCELRCTIEGLRTPEDAPLDVLVERVAASFRTRFGLALELDVDAGLQVGLAQRAAARRVLGEALANAVVHGGATHVLVRVERGERGLAVRVEDDGRGFDATSAAPGWGLVGMRERVELLGGELSVVSRYGSGAVVEAVLP